MTKVSIDKSMFRIKPVVAIVIILGVTVVFTGLWALRIYGYIYKPNVLKDGVVLIRNGATITDVENSLKEQQLLGNIESFKWVAGRKKYAEKIKPGRYEVKKDWNNHKLVNKLRIGIQDPLNVTFNTIRTFPELAGKLSKYLEADSVALVTEFMKDSTASSYSYTKETFPVMFIPNTYQLYWTTTPSQFVERMKKEYDRYWNDQRQEKAKALGLTPVQVAVLASIVQEETNRNDEKPIVAGVYLNRLKIGMILQADPTVKFAIGDFTIHRVSTAMTQTVSPYNTYLNAGLPPGPIAFPELTSLEAVLNAQKHDYLYFCANSDLSGTSVFARTLAEHSRNAAKYQSELNRRKIWK